MGRIFIYAKDISELQGVSVVQAKRIIRTIKDSLSKLPHQNLTIVEYANYEGIDFAIVDKVINPVRGTK